MVTTESVTIRMPVGMSKLGYSYLDMTMNELDLELETFRQLKKKEGAKSRICQYT